MARVTVEDCIDKVENRFDLVLLASHRARMVSSGAPITIDRDNDKNPVVALREIAEALREVSAQTPDPLCLLRAEQVADLLDLPVRTVRDQASAGVIPHRRFGKHYRFNRDDVEAIVRQMAREPRPQRRSFRAL